MAKADVGVAVTHHQILLDGNTLAYTATAGHVVAANLQTGAPEASFFYVAYTLDGQNAAQRPVTFFYNGGPGSPSMWLHLGSFGPRRLVTGDPSATPATPFPLVDNSESLLDVTDMVFVDAVGTGYSEAIAPNTNQTFWSVASDAAAFRDFVISYLKATQRTASPKFLFGESYGTLRTDVLADLLEEAGTDLKGIVLQSSILNYNTNCEMFAQDQVSCEGYLPTYGAIGAYFGLDTPAEADLGSFTASLRSYDTTTYVPAVDAFLAQGTPPVDALTTQLFDDTGAAAALWKQDLDLYPDSYRYGLLPGALIGRYDARVSAATNSPLSSEGDPSSTVISDQFVAAIARYLPDFLDYTSTSTYATDETPINYWNFSYDGNGLPDSIPDLATAMVLNPSMGVLSLNGYHDLATPFYETEQDLGRLPSQQRVQIDHYDGGHMTYLDDGSRPLEKADIAKFVTAAAAVKSE